MSWQTSPRNQVSRRLLLLGSAATALAGCGFQPVYGPRDNLGQRPVARALAAIRIPPIAERSGQILHNFLITDITPAGAPASPTHSLEVFLSESESQRGLDGDAFTQRASLRVRAEYALVNLGNDRVELKGLEENTVGFNLENRIDNVFSAIVSREDAREQALRAISRQITTRLAIFASANMQTPQG